MKKLKIQDLSLLLLGGGLLILGIITPCDCKITICAISSLCFIIFGYRIIISLIKQN